MIAPFIAQVRSLSWLLHSGVLRPHIPSCVLQVLMSRSVIQALTPFAVASLICAFGTFLLPIETKGRALLVRNLLARLLRTLSVVLEDLFHLISAKLLMAAAEAESCFFHQVDPTSRADPTCPPVGKSRCLLLDTKSTRSIVQPSSPPYLEALPLVSSSELAAEQDRSCSLQGPAQVTRHFIISCLSWRARCSIGQPSLSYLWAEAEQSTSLIGKTIWNNSQQHPSTESLVLRCTAACCFYPDVAHVTLIYCGSDRISPLGGAIFSARDRDEGSQATFQHVTFTRN